jgi:hypothetical protein
MPNGRVAEWFIAAVLKTVGWRRPVGSNPTPSASVLQASPRRVANN